MNSILEIIVKRLNCNNLLLIYLKSNFKGRDYLCSLFLGVCFNRKVLYLVENRLILLVISLEVLFLEVKRISI